MPVTERDGVIIGLVTEFDVIRALQAGKPAATTVAEAIMTRDVVTVDVTTSLEEVVDVLERERFLRVPVTENGRLVGVVSRPDVLRWLIEPNFMTFS
jgi:CBS domain-containing protein